MLHENQMKDHSVFILLSALPAVTLVKAGHLWSFALRASLGRSLPRLEGAVIIGHLALRAVICFASFVVIDGFTIDLLLNDH